MVKMIVVVLAIGSVAHAETHIKPLVGITSVTPSSEVKDSVYTTWQVIAPGGMGQWCVNTPSGGVGETLTIAFDPPAKLDGISIGNVSGQTNQLGEIEVNADGRTVKAVVKPAKLGNSSLEAKLDGKPTKKLVLKIAAIAKGKAPATCMGRVDFMTTPDVGIVYGVTAADIAALTPRVTAIQDALRSCKGLGDALKFPFSWSEMSMDNDGMKEHVHSYKDAAAATAACHKKKLAGVLDWLGAEQLMVTPKEPGEVVIGGGWRVGLVDKTWRLIHGGPT
jgi:hypothetical protein